MREGTKALAVGVLTLLVGVVTAGCSGEAGAGDVNVRVYSSFALQDAGESEGSGGAAEIVRGMQLALRDAGGHAGRYRVELVSLDDASPETRQWSRRLVEANARRAAGDKRAVAYIGEGHSGATVHSLPITNRAGLLQVAPLATYVGLTRPEGADPGEPEKYYPSGARTFGRVIQNDRTQAAATVAYMRSEGVRKAVLFHEGSLYGEGLVRLITELAPKGPVEVVDGHRMTGERGGVGDVHWPRAARLAAASGAQAIYFAGIPEIRQLRSIHAAEPGLKIFGPEDFLINDDAARGIDRAGMADVVFATAGLVEDDGELIAGIRERYRAAYGERASLQAVYAHEAMAVVLDAIRRAGKATDVRKAVREAFFATQDRPSPFGTYSIDRYGDVTTKTFAAQRVRDGAFRPAGEIDVSEVLAVAR
jgi:branched-chain amino acid transport system substrate-binding protein